jgi:copper transport protein
MRLPRRILRYALVLGAICVPSVASAHLALRRSEPANGARLARSPAAVTLWFTERPQLGFTRVSLSSPEGEIVLRELSADTGHAVRAALPRPLSPGEYLVSWQAASADGHVIRGEFRFAVASGPAVAQDTTPAPVHAHPPQPETHSTHEAYRGIRWIEFAALVTVLGAIGFRHLVLPALASRSVPTADAFDRARRLGQAMLALYLPAGAVRLYTEWLVVRGPEPGDAFSLGGLRQLLVGTTWGAGWAAGVAGAVVVLLGWRLSKRGVPGAVALVVAGGIAMAASPALTGHAAADSPALLSVVVDALHVLAASVWVGGLLMVMLAGIPAMLRLPDDRGHPAVLALVNSFHPVALFCVPLLAATGIASTWMRTGGLLPTLDSGYGRVLAWKLLLFIGVAALGLHNSARARRRLGSPEATRSFRISAAAELAFAAAVLAATTILVVTPLPKP